MDNEKVFYPYIKTLPKQGDVRKGDSGGALFVGDTVAGIFSHGHCDENTQTFTNAYSASVAESYDWIVKTTGVSYNEDGTVTDNGKVTSTNGLNTIVDVTSSYAENQFSSEDSFLSSLSSR